MKTKTLRKSLLALLVVFAMVFTYVPAMNPNIQEADAASVIKTHYEDGSGFLFNLYDDGTAAAAGYKGDTVPTELVVPATCIQKGEGGNPDVEYKVTEVSLSTFKKGDGSSNTTAAKAVIESIVISEGITRINYAAINGFSELKNVKLPDSLTTILGNSFDGCPKLEAMHIPKNVNEIVSGFCADSHNMKISVAAGNTHFKVIDGALYTADMTRMIFLETRESVVVPETVTTIDYPVFTNRGGIKHVTLPSNMTEFGTSPFLNCADLETVVLPKAITAIPSNCFQSCAKLKSIEIPEGVTTIGGVAFAGCTSLEKVVLPSTLKSLADQRIFHGCTSLKSVVIPEGVTSIPKRAFRDCTGLVSVTIPASVTTIDGQAFQGVDLSKVVVITEKGSAAEAFFANTGAQVMEYTAPKIKTETLPNAVAGTEYSQKLEADGYPVPEFSVVQGELPEGMTLAADGKLSGTPAEAGVYTFTVKAYNMGTDTQELTLTVEEPAADVPGGDDADKDNKDDATQTGDNSNMVPFIALMIAALIAAGAAVVRRREN